MQRSRPRPLFGSSGTCRFHDLSILAQTCDLSPVSRVYAYGRRHYGAHEEIGHLHLPLADGVEPRIHVSWHSPVGLRQTIIGGTRKMVLFDDTQPPARS
jgi:hypothetical protein